ncbi:MAG: flagellar hook-length control protein FliK, partial [Aliarcobacter sp.]|nr:flagellar hook-length control protein FliK [Aliarcobacter sp.]
EREETASKSKIDVNIKDIEIEEKVEVSLDGEVKEDNKTSIEIKDTKNIDTKIVKEEKVVSINSLLDRLVLEAKKDVKTISEEDVKTIEREETASKSKIDVNIKDIEIEEKVEVSLDGEVKKLDANVELTIDKVITAVDNNIEKDTSNKTKVNISNTISVPLSDSLNSLDNLVSSKNVESKSLMDQLIQKNSENIKSINPEKMDMIERESASKDFISNIYLSSQKNSMNTQNLFNKNEAVNLLKNATNIGDVKTSAQILDLGLEDISVEQITETQKIVDITKRLDIDLFTKRNILDNLILDKNIKSEDVKNLITKSVEASSALLDNTLNLADDAMVTVNSPLSYNIQSKIIGARQQMSTMMSDIAKQMYENYKPPVTVFKINLNPLELGSIAILIKNDKNNALSISMNVSNNTTLDALVDNQNVLRNSLNKTFDENTKFNLDFSSSNQNNNQSSNQNKQNNQNKYEVQIDTQSILKLKEENKDREEKSIDYM